MSVSALSAVRLAYAYADAVSLFEDASFQVGPGFFGLVGENGAGKTTLLRLILGELVPTAGQLCIEPAWGRVVLCAQSVELLPPGVRELAAATDREAHRLRARLKLQPLDLDRWPTLSSGERKRWQVGAALYAKPDILLLDEPSNHLDASARSLLIDALRRFGGTALLVSHDRLLLDALTVGTLRLRAGQIELLHLPYSQARAAWDAQDEARSSARQAARERVWAVERQIVAARRDQDGATHSRSTRHRMKSRYDSDARTLGAGNLAEWAQARAGQRVAAQRSELVRAEDRLAALAPVPRAVGRSLFVDWSPPSRPVLLSLALSALWAGSRRLAGPLCLTLRRQDRVHLRGPNGAGKSTLVRALLAACTLPPDRVLHLPQELSQADAQALVSALRSQPPAQRGRTLSLLAALGVDPDRLLASESLSCGEARKLALALAMARHAWLLVLDEPTNHLDLPSIERLESALSAYPGALLLVSHDEALAQRLTKSAWDVLDANPPADPASP
jgi:ATPase subunit of ABC transporter with duplicated ATPase domains